jgi:hypothetical protein
VNTLKTWIKKPGLFCGVSWRLTFSAVDASVYVLFFA